MSNEQMSQSNTITREQAQKDLEMFQARQTEVRKMLEEAQVAQRAATVAVNNAKSLVMEADARVLLAKATLQRLGGAAPVANKQGASDQSKVQQAVVNVLRANGPTGLTVDEIYTRIQGDDIKMAGANPRSNLTAYLNRWSKVAGSGIVSAGRGFYKFDGSSEAAPEVPAFLASPTTAELPGGDVTEAAEVPAFLAPVEDPEPLVLTEVPYIQVDGSLPEGFPGLEALAEAGYTTRESLAGKTHDQLRRIKGVGAETARQILAALEA